MAAVRDKLGSKQPAGDALSLSRAAPHQDDRVCFCEKVEAGGGGLGLDEGVGWLCIRTSDTRMKDCGCL